MASALKPGIHKTDHNQELVFLLDGKRARHGSKHFLHPGSCIVSMPQIENESASYVLNPRKAIDENRTSCLFTENDENTQLLLERWSKESVWNFEGLFLLGYHKESPGIVFRSKDRAKEFFAGSFFQKRHSIILDSLKLMAPANILFLPLDALLSMVWSENPFKELKVSEVAVYGIPNEKETKTPTHSQNKTAQPMMRSRKLDLVELATTLNACKGQDIENNENLAEYISQRLSFVKFLRIHFRWETEAIFWNLPVWWRCEIAYHRPESTKKLNSLKYGVDYFFDIFHLVEVIILNPEFLSNKNAIDNETLEKLADKYFYSNFQVLGDKMDLPSRIFQLATYFQYRVFDESYFQEMLIDDGWEIFEVVSADSKRRKSLNQNLFFIPPEFRSRLKISQENFIRFIADRDYFTNRRQVVDYVLKNYSNHRKFLYLNDANSSTPSIETSFEQNLQDQSDDRVQFIGSNDGDNIEYNSKEEISWAHPAPPPPSSLDMLKGSWKMKPPKLQNISSVVFGPTALDRSSALGAVEVTSFQMMTEAAKNKRKQANNKSDPSPRTVTVDNNFAVEDDSDVEFIEDNNNDITPETRNDPSEKRISSSTLGGVGAKHNNNSSTISHKNDNTAGTNGTIIPDQDPVIAAKLAYFARFPGASIVNKHENDDPERPVILYVINYEPPKLTQIPLPIGCDPNYVLKFPAKTTQLQGQSNMQKVASTDFDVGSKRPASNRTLSTKRTRLSDEEDDDNILPVSEELNGYSIF